MSRKQAVINYDNHNAAQFMTANYLVEQTHFSTTTTHTTVEVKRMTPELELKESIMQEVRMENERLLHAQRMQYQSFLKDVESLLYTFKNEILSAIHTTSKGDVDPMSSTMMATEFIWKKAQRIGMTFDEVAALTPEIKVDHALIPELEAKHIVREVGTTGPLLNTAVLDAAIKTPTKRGGRTSKHGLRINWASMSDREKLQAGFAVIDQYISDGHDITDANEFRNYFQSAYLNLMNLCKQGDRARWSDVTLAYVNR